MAQRQLSCCRHRLGQRCGGVNHHRGRKTATSGGLYQRDDETKPDVFELSGSVKWFDPSKGYGFIVPDEDLPDVLLHVTCLRRGGFQTACEGARAVCEVVRSPRVFCRPSASAAWTIRGDPSIAVAAAHPCCRRPRGRLGKSGGEVVQPTTRISLHNEWSPDARYLCAYGNTPALRFHRAQARPDRARALWQETKRSHRGGT